MQYCSLNLTLHFNLRGSEVQVQLKKSDIKFEKDGKGEAGVRCSFDRLYVKELTRRYWRVLFPNLWQNAGGKASFCNAVASWKASPRSWTLISASSHRKTVIEKPVWFAKMPMGKVVVQDMMPRISMHSDLSVRYTDHCVRATRVVILKKAGFEDREVCFITGHLNPNSLSSYSQPDEEMKAKMALALDTKPISDSSTSLVVSLSENTNEKETSGCAERTGWKSPQCRSTTPPPEILLSPATNTPAGIVFNAPNSSLHNVTINLGHRTNRSTLTLKRKHQDWHCLKRIKYWVVLFLFLDNRILTNILLSTKNYHAIVCLAFWYNPG